MQTPIDVLARRQQEMAEQTAAAEAAHKANVNRFVELWLTLGADVMKLDGTRHDAELAEAKGLAAARWNGLVGMESQIQREEAALAIRPKNRPTQPGDDELPDRTLKQRDAEWQDKTKYLRDSLAALKAEAASERRLLESYITKAR
jgi:hypothetical protein